MEEMIKNKDPMMKDLKVFDDLKDKDGFLDIAKCKAEATKILNHVMNKHNTFDALKTIEENIFMGYEGTGAFPLQ